MNSREKARAEGSFRADGGTRGGIVDEGVRDLGRRENGSDAALQAVQEQRATPLSPSKAARRAGGVQIPRHFTTSGGDPYASVEWELRTAKIANERGETIFEQPDCEIPKDWSQLATNVVVSKYFRGHVGTPERERSVKQLVGRVVGRLHEWGAISGYFRTPEDGRAFSDELTHLLSRVANVVQIAGAFGIKAVSIVFEQGLAEAIDASKRSTQVM